MSSALPFDASVYPRTYGVSLLRTAGSTALIILVLSVPLLRLFHASYILLLLGIVGFAQVFLFRSALMVTLYADRIEVKTGRRTTVLQRDAIAGYRIIQGKISVYLFVPKPGRELSDWSTGLTVSRNVKTDAAWDAWLADIPDLDAEARAAVLAEIESVPELGATPAARVAHWRHAVWMSWGLWAVTLFLSLLLLVGHAAADAALVGLIAMPWLALLLVGLWISTFSQPRLPTSGPILILLFLIPMPGIPMVFLEIGTNYHYVRPVLPFAAGGVILLTLTLATMFLVRRNVMYVAISMFTVTLFSYLYCYQVVSITNYRLDSGRPTMIPVIVKEKHQSVVTDHGQTFTKYELYFQPWGPEKSVAQEAVSSREFIIYAVGDTVCATLFSGGLGIEWYRLVIPYRPNSACK